jgi:hypothetical protein
MKKLLIVLPLLFACKTTKKASCDAYGDILKVDTLHLDETHAHIQFNGNYKCIYRPKETVTITWWVFKDTTKTK